MSSQAVSRYCPSLCQGISQKIQTVGATCKKVISFGLNFFYTAMDCLKVPFYGCNRVFHNACAKDHWMTVSLFLKRVDINQKDRDGHTPLSTACIHKNEDIIEFLIKKRADVEQAFKNTFPHNALSLERHMDLKTLQRINANLIEASNHKTSLMAELAYDFDPDLAKALSKKGLDLELLFHELLLQAHQVDSDVARGLAETGLCSFRAFNKFLAIEKILRTLDQAIAIYEETKGCIHDFQLATGDSLFFAAVQTGCAEVVEYLISRKDIKLEEEKSIAYARDRIEENQSFANIVKLLETAANGKEIPSIREENRRRFDQLVEEEGAHRRIQNHLKETFTILL